MLEKAHETTRHGSFWYMTYARWADALVILVHADRRQDWLLKAVHRRLREELAKLGIPVNEAKSRVVDLEEGEAFTFLGFDFRQVRNPHGAWWPQYTPTRHKRTELLQKLREVFRRQRSHSGQQLIREINPILAATGRRTPDAAAVRDDRTAARDAVDASGIAASSRLPTVRPVLEVGVVSEKSAADAVVPNAEGPRRAQTGFPRFPERAPDRETRLAVFDGRNTGIKTEISVQRGTPAQSRKDPDEINSVRTPGTGLECP